jgi:3'(2'), 5'-bisphosphate nucleotidase
MNLKIYLLAAMAAALEAGQAILDVYRSSDFEVQQKADQSPLTLADRRAHEVIAGRLAVFDIPLLSEEGKDIAYEQRKRWDTYWLIDPLDGTKEFIKKNGEFTVNIAIIQDRRPIAGVVGVPDKDVVYFALKDLGAFKLNLDKGAAAPDAGVAEILDMDPEHLNDDQADRLLAQLMSRAFRLPVDDGSNRPYTIMGSRSHGGPELEAFVAEKRKQHGEVEFISAGSSLKLCLVAEGRADIYPRTGPTMEWDTAAGHAIAEAAGARVLQYDTDAALVYNKQNLLNPWFVVIR